LSDSARMVLLADDDPVMRELASAKLKEAGYSVTTAEDGAEALALLKQMDADLVISDIDMPNMNGYELTEAIRKDETLCEIPVMVITASDQSDAVDRAFASGATSFLAKPMNWSLFHHAVKFVLRASDDRRDLKAAKDQAEAGARFKDSLMSVMSHELRTPLNAIIGFGQILAERFDQQQDNMHNEYAEYIIDGGRRLLNSVSDMLLASDARSGPIGINETDVCLGDIMEEALGSIEKTLRLAEVTPVQRLCSENLEICCDRGLVAKAVRKLVDNSVKFSPKGVSVVIGAALTRSGDLAIVVKDNGPGVKPELLDKVTAPFEQIDMSFQRSREGLGLGLPLVQAIAKAHGGSFRIDSVVNEGTRAIIVLPSRRVQEMPGSMPKQIKQEQGREVA